MLNNEQHQEKMSKEYKELIKKVSNLAYEFSQPLQVLSMILTEIESGEVKPNNAKRGQKMISKIVELANQLKTIAGGDKNSLSELKISEQFSKLKLSTEKKWSILIVDDNKDIVDMMMENFKLLGYNCEGVTEGEIALSLIKKNNYDLIISDLLMPKITGKDLFCSVKEFGYKGKFIFLTGYVVSEEQKKIVAQAEGLLYKPFQLTELFNFVQKILEE